MKNLRQKENIIGVLCAIGCETFYGLSYIFTKQATECADEFALLGWRFFIAILVMSLCVLFGLIKINLKGKSLKPLLLVALCSPCIYFIAETIGISHTTASESGVFLASIPVISLIASTLFLKEKPIKIQIFGILITLTGVFVTVFVVNVSSSLSALGYLSLVIAVMSYALYSVFVSKATDYTEVEITYIMLLTGAVLFILVAIIQASIHGELVTLLQLPVKNPRFLIAILYQGIGCSIFAFFLSNLAIAKIGVNRTSSFIGISTVVSILAGALLLHEPFTKGQIVGAGIIVAGVYIANVKMKNKCEKSTI